ncbi:hypothetical protein POL68_19990 [Stigmatella sp. ncwal1]|uniref:Uncharacterized protein n=1 Tax=Stigmatella ashevillensis TaxID=2995309 RepID=A0ABT5DAT5_9BACT|nr:hypothetical protein [Stigmatella ashevillena]MDC0710768.1 hypothetical protein [Stigmatella ashevillena]
MRALARVFHGGAPKAGMGHMVDIERVALLRDGEGWAVDVMLKGGAELRYRYGSEGQARYFAAVFSLGPSVLPPSSDHVFRRRKKARRGTLSARSLG